MGVEIGQVVAGKYRITRMLGVGGMGTVYEGLHEDIKRRVAIKVLHPHVAAEGSLVRRFEREAQAAAQIGSPHIVDVLDWASLPSGERFMVMELLRGESLSRAIKRGISLVDLFAVILEVLEGLADAHDAGIVHRDLKPANVILCVGGGRKASTIVKIVDFGVSKFRDLTPDAGTTTGMMMGTPHYMAPEQTNSKDVGPRSDLYSVGVILFRGLSGRLPYDASSMPELIRLLLTADAPRLDTVVEGIHPSVTALVAKALARDPDERFQSADELAEAMRACLVELGLPASPPLARQFLESIDEDTTPYGDDDDTPKESGDASGMMATTPLGSNQEGPSGSDEPLLPSEPSRPSGASVSSGPKGPSPPPAELSADTIQMPTPISQASLPLPVVTRHVRERYAIIRNPRLQAMVVVAIGAVLVVGLAIAITMVSREPRESPVTVEPPPEPVQQLPAPGALPKSDEALPDDPVDDSKDEDDDTAAEPATSASMRVEPKPATSTPTKAPKQTRPQSRRQPAATGPTPRPKERTDNIRTDL